MIKNFFYQDVLPAPSTEDDSDIEISEDVDVKVKDKLISGNYWKQINIQRSHPYKKIMSSILLYPVFYEHKNCTFYIRRNLFITGCKK